MDFEAERRAMVRDAIAARGVADTRVLQAVGAVRREHFVPPEMAEFAYADTPLPIDAGQTISQPFIVALMAEAAEIGPDDRVLEIGAGSGYSAAVLASIAAEVVTIERHHTLVVAARRRLEAEGFPNVRVVEGDGTLGFPEAGPYDAIVVTAGGPRVPEALREQLADGGRMVIPVGNEDRHQELLRIRRRGDDFEESDLGPVRFVPLIGDQGWKPASGLHDQGVVGSERRRPPTHHAHLHGLPLLIAESASPFGSVDEAPLDAMLDRIGDCRYVLIGEATHGTAEFYRLRELITRELIVRKGFTAVAVEADWPDASIVDDHVRRRPTIGAPFRPFDRFPTWMWRNRQVSVFVDWLRTHNDGITDPGRQVSFHGLDIYSLFRSRDAVLAYLDRVDPAAAVVARDRYSCLTPWEADPAAYGRAVMTRGLRGCEDGIVDTLTDLLRQRLAYRGDDGDHFLNAAQNALIVAGAERYYRVMYRGGNESWNLRDQHMFETLRTVQAHRGDRTKIVVWEHNSHVGDAAATEMGARGEHNVGMLARRAFGNDAYLIGFGTDHGMVAAASDWGGPMEHKSIRPAHSGSYERLCHDTTLPAFVLPLRHPGRPDLPDELAGPRLERAIGVIYRPETELASHYFQASLPHQFDEYIWIDETHPVTAANEPGMSGVPDTYPFGL